ncbi:A24 family peptidase [Thermoactinomyces sp. DSM 45892]|uniref:prepilin peptidase n=1 Tax=Thermoactinomyces sp. DSM 45892 TaxID=1882753 RepID=UPI00089B1E81|nr:A24 family peptidase [Thermoactinomyces sp. DSM 45892]SDY80052.1 Type IV leader peptidase family protein [Thermoactinomyces sp. DSM 45892]
MNTWQWIICIVSFGLLPNITHIYLTYRQKRNQLHSSWKDELPKKVTWWMNGVSLVYGTALLSIDSFSHNTEWFTITGILWIMGMIVWSDLWMGVIPNLCVIVICGLGVVEQIRSQSYQEYLQTEWLVGLGILFLFIVLVWLTRSMGWGDIKLVTALFIWLGTWNWIIHLWIACVSACVVVLLRALTTKQVARKQKIAFGPYIVLGAIMAWMAGETMWAGYLEWFLSF